MPNSKKSSLFFFIAAIAISALIIRFYPEKDDVASVEVLSQSFADIVFSFNDSDQQRLNSINKWTMPVVISLKGDRTDKDETELKAAISLLQRLSGLDIRVAGHGVEANITLNFIERRDLAAQMHRLTTLSSNQIKEYAKDTVCFFAIRQVNETGIQRTEAVFAPFRSRWSRSRCIFEEMAQMLGATEDKAHYSQSIFSDNSSISSLSINDMILIRTLYDEHIKHGMPFEAGMFAATRILAELREKVLKHGVEALYQH